jgi:hypothetical protein
MQTKGVSFFTIENPENKSAEIIEEFSKMKHCQKMSAVKKAQ